MKKSIYISFFTLFLALSIIICSVGRGVLSEQLKMLKNNSIRVQATLPQTSKAVQSTTSAETAYTILEKDAVVLCENETKILLLSQSEQENLVGFETSDDGIVAVDSGGRVDALKTGQVVVTATFSDSKKYTYSVTVNPEQKSEYDGFSTCIIANSDVLDKNKSSKSSKNLYIIKVNRKQNCVTVYTYDKNGEYNVPVRAMICSTGKDNSTVTGDFDIYFKKNWNALFNNVYGRYVSGFYGDFLFHSVPYYSEMPNRLEVEEFNKLGIQASLGCVRMAVADVKWIYSNCPENTKVTVYDDDNAGPLGKPDSIKITDKSCGWDPTDNNKSNPYNSRKPQITGVHDITIKNGEEFKPLKGIKVFDTCSNDITDKLEVVGNVITSKDGTYKVTYSVTDAMHRKTSKTIKVTVK